MVFGFLPLGARGGAGVGASAAAKLVFVSLEVLIDEDMPGVRLNSLPGKRQVERYLFEVVDATTRFVHETPTMMVPMDPVARLGLTGLENEDLNIDEDEIQQAWDATDLGELLGFHSDWVWSQKRHHLSREPIKRW